MKASNTIFQFFYKATLLQRREDLLRGIERHLNEANALVSHYEDSLKPALKELEGLQEKIRSMEYMEEISQQVQLLRKKLAWSWVLNEADRKLDMHHKRIEKLKGRIPSCQERIDQNHHKMKELTDQLSKKKQEISNMMETTSEVRQMKEELQQNYSVAWKEKLELEREHDRIYRQTANLVQQVESLGLQTQELQDQFVQSTQAEENEMEERLRKLQVEVDEANVNIQRFKEEEDDMSQRIAMLENEIEIFSNEWRVYTRGPRKVWNVDADGAVDADESEELEDRNAVGVRADVHGRERSGG